MGAGGATALRTSVCGAGVEVAAGSGVIEGRSAMAGSVGLDAAGGRALGVRRLPSEDDR